MQFKTYILASFLAAGLLTGCKLDIPNPNAPTDEQVLSSREGMLTLSLGMKQYYSTSALEALIITPGTTTRELKGITTFTNVLELEAGGTALPSFNGNVLNLWARMYRVMGMADELIANAPTVLATDEATRNGVLAHAYLFKAMALGGLATGFEQFPTQTNKNGQAPFVPRQQALTEAVTILSQGIDLITATAPSTEFNTRVLGTDFQLRDCLNAYRARYQMMLGRYADALASANAVNLTSRSQFVYSSQSPNPIYQQIVVSKNYQPRATLGLPTSLLETGDARINFYTATPEVTVGGEVLRSVAGFFNEITKPIPVYLPDEIRLIKAEALVRSNGSITEAVAQINAVRTQTTGDPFGVNAALPAYAGGTDAASLLTEIYKQRSTELFMQGLRLEDSRRFNRTAPAVNVNPIPLTAERTRNFYPYPDQERLTNPNTPAEPAI
ncbi:RagB/SusD family nutrient uptake outer membrane protein [Siphonobacter sp. BAB-5405]|uniref:RagB/SusD family nutrient uptake outer membrane protein n=1 Tax=Siphonobacter sp. BAB-5405 TaxID=1864825 RepID=UPI001E2D4859|nr:RagB/SusD family nutrient uptake outer membrane protein [Siphonobacter sp. BAB-5405]